MTEQIVLVPETPPTLRPARMSLEFIDAGNHPPIDPAFVQSIRRYGVIQPPVVRETAWPRHKVVDGRRRVAAAQYVRMDEDDPQIEVLVLEGNCSPSVLALMLNEQRSRNPASDLHAIEDLAAKGASLEEIAAATGMGKGTVAKRMRLANLILNFRALFDEGKLPVGIAERLATLPAALQGDLYLHYAQAGKITHGDISEMRHAQQQEAVAGLGDILTDAHEGGPSPAPIPAPVEATQERTRIEFPDALTARKEAYYYLLFICDAKGNAAYDKVLQQLYDEILEQDPAWDSGEQPKHDDFFLWAQKLLAAILVKAPSDAPRSCLDSLGFVATVFADLAESQAPDFLAEDERVDISDVEPVDDTPYDEEYETESEAAD